jgi:hypothetical protein
MRIGFYRAEVVDRDDLEVFAAGLDDRPQNQAPDASKTIDRDANGHR